MLNENIIALDTLSAEKHMVKDLTSAIVETGNQNLKETLKQIRSQTERAHQEIYQIAEQNGWYMAAGQASPQQMSEFHRFFNQNLSAGINPGNQQQYLHGDNRLQQQRQSNYRGEHQNAQSSPQYTYQGTGRQDQHNN